MLRFKALIHGERSGPLEVTFDQAFAALYQLPRLFIEPDGSFVWTGASPSGQAWQVDGNLIDQGDRLAHVELNGRCAVEQFNLLLAALGGPPAKFTFQLPQRGQLLTEAEFRRLAASESGAV